MKNHELESSQVYTHRRDFIPLEEFTNPPAEPVCGYCLNATTDGLDVCPECEKSVKELQ